MRKPTVILVVIVATVILLLNLYGIYQLATLFAKRTPEEIVEEEYPEYESLEPETTTPKFVLKYKFDRTSGNWERRPLLVTDSTVSLKDVTRVSITSRRPDIITTPLQTTTTPQTTPTTTEITRESSVSTNHPRLHHEHHGHRQRIHHGERVETQTVRQRIEDSKSQQTSPPYRPSTTRTYLTTTTTYSTRSSYSTPVTYRTSTGRNRASTNRVRIRDPLDDVLPRHYGGDEQGNGGVRRIQTTNRGQTTTREQITTRLQTTTVRSRSREEVDRDNHRRITVDERYQHRYPNSNRYPDGRESTIYQENERRTDNRYPDTRNPIVPQNEVDWRKEDNRHHQNNQHHHRHHQEVHRAHGYSGHPYPVVDTNSIYSRRMTTTTTTTTISTTTTTSTTTTSTRTVQPVLDGVEDPFKFETHGIDGIEGVGEWPTLEIPKIEPFEDPDEDDHFERIDAVDPDENETTVLPSATIPTTVTTEQTTTVYRGRPTTTRAPYVEMYNGDITIVTALMDIGRGDWWEYRRPLDKYHEFMENLMSLKNNMVIFTDSHSYDFVKDYRDKMGMAEITKIYLITLEDLPLWRYHKDAQEIIHNEHNDTNKWRTVWDPQMMQHPEAKSAEYDVVVNSKTHFLHNVTLENPFSTDFFVWIDAGYGHGNQSIFPYDNVWRPSFPKNKVSVIKLTPEHDPISGYRIEKLYRQNWSVISGGFIAGDKHTIGQLHTMVHRKFIELIHRDRVDDDQTTMVLVINSNPSLFNIVHAGWFDAFRKFDPIFQ